MVVCALGPHAHLLSTLLHEAAHCSSRVLGTGADAGHTGAAANAYAGRSTSAAAALRLMLAGTIAGR